MSPNLSTPSHTQLTNAFFVHGNLIGNIMLRHRTAKADRLSASCVQLLLSSDTSPELEDDLALRKIRFSTYSNIVSEYESINHRLSKVL